MLVESASNRLYHERPGANVDAAITILSKAPEFSPDDKERREALTIELALTRGVDLYSTLLNDDTPERPIVNGVEKIFLENKVNTLDFFVDYFTSSREGFHALVLLGFEAQGDEIHEDEVIKFLSGFDYASVNSNSIAEIAGKSQEFVEKTVADAMEENGYESLDGLTEPTKVTIVKNPEKLANKLNQLKDLKGFLKKYASSENAVNSPQISAVISMHRRRINEMIAQSYPDAIALVRQYKASPNEKSEDAISVIAKATNAISFESDDVGSFALARLDKFLNGADKDIKVGDHSPVSDAALVIANEILERRKGGKEKIEGKYSEYGDATVVAKVDSAEFQKWIKKVLSEYGILSSIPEKEYQVDRSGPAEDGQWQVVIHPTAKNLSVDEKQRVVNIPPNFSRNLSQLSPAGAVPLLDHEIEHVVQWENKRRLGIALAELVSVDRSNVYSEGGGVMQEADSQRRLFGQDRGTNIDYMKAAIAKLDGGNYLDCVKAFFDSNIAADSQKNKRKAAELSANRVLRLFRNEGSLSDTSAFLSNSQPLVYLEQDLVVKRLKERGMERLLHFGINLDVLAGLHRVGLLDVNKMWLPERIPSDILEPEIREKLEAVTS